MCSIAVPNHQAVRSWHTIVSISREAMAAFLQFSVKIIEQNISQHRRKWTPLRGAHFAWLKTLPSHHARSQVSANQRQQPFIAGLSGHTGHQDIVLNIVEKFRQVQVGGNSVASP